MYNYEIEITYIDRYTGLENSKFLVLIHKEEFSNYELNRIINNAIAEIEFDCITDFEFELYSWLKTYWGFNTPKIKTSTSIDFDLIMEEKYE